jgi:cytochrome P450
MTAERFPPGPKAHFLVGNLPEFRQDPLGFMTMCARNYGDIVRYRIANVTVYSLNHPDYIEYVLVGNSRNFIKGRLLRANQIVLGNGLLTSEGDLWVRQRRLAQPAFHREQIAAYGQIIVAYTERMLATWQNGEIRDIYQDMRRLTLEITAKTLFDADVADRAEDVVAALEVVREQFVARVNTALLIPEGMPTPANLRLRKAVRQLEEIVYGIIQERRTSGRDHGDLLSMLFHAQDEDGGQMTAQQLRDEVMTLFVAGHETTAIALAWTWYLLSQHPTAEARLVSELQEVLVGRAPDTAHLPHLGYTDRVLKESLRLYSPVWCIPRVALADCDIGGYRVPAGTSLAMSPWVMHRDPRYFDQPEEFNPDRWEGDFAKRLPTFAYFPFGGGPRRCIGYSFATLEMALVLATIAQEFQLALVPGHPVTLSPSFTLQPRDGIKVVVNKRSCRSRNGVEVQQV